MPNLRLTGSPPPGWKHLSSRDRDLFERLPADYREFLDCNNGGFVAPGCDAHFDIAMERRNGEVVTSISEQNWLEEFFAVIPSDTAYERQYGKAPASLFHEHWNRHADEKFLPFDVIAIGSCNQSCLLACSLNPEDFGSIYYWEWYWYYPWFSKFFNDRIEKAQSMYPDITEILNDTSHPLYREAFNASNYATLIKVADSFSALIQGLKAEPRADA